jgi:hypothetical protein
VSGDPARQVFSRVGHEAFTIASDCGNAFRDPLGLS